MSDDKTNRGPARINIHEAYEGEYWSAVPVKRILMTSAAFLITYPGH